MFICHIISIFVHIFVNSIVCTIQCKFLFEKICQPKCQHISTLPSQTKRPFECNCFLKLADNWHNNWLLDGFTELAIIYIHICQTHLCKACCECQLTVGCACSLTSKCRHLFYLHIYLLLLFFFNYIFLCKLLPLTWYI